MIAWLVIRFCKQQCRRARDQQHQRHADELRPVIVQQRPRLVAGDQRDDAADEDRDRRVENRDDKAGDEQRRRRDRRAWRA